MKTEYKYQEHNPVVNVIVTILLLPLLVFCLVCFICCIPIVLITWFLVLCIVWIEHQLGGGGA